MSVIVAPVVINVVDGRESCHGDFF